MVFAFAGADPFTNNDASCAAAQKIKYAEQPICNVAQPPDAGPYYSNNSKTKWTAPAYNFNRTTIWDKQLKK
jgi:hypothetical protein